MAAEVQATLAGSLSAALREPGDAPFLGRRRDPNDSSSAFEWLTYRQVADTAAELAAGLAALSIPRRATIGIASENRPEWLQADFACAFGDFMNVGLHLAWSETKLASVMEDSEVQCVIAMSTGLHRLAAAAALCPHTIATTFIVLDCETGEDLEPVRQMLAKRDETPILTTWADVLLAGRQKRTTHTGFGFEDDEDHFDLLDDPLQPYTLMYSSGTSGGAPKATMNSKRLWRESNCTPGVFANISLCKRRAVSYLALAHGADRGIAWQTTYAGGTIGFVRGEEDFEGLLVDLREVRPTFFLGFAGFWSALFKRHEAQLNTEVDADLAAQLCASGTAKRRVLDEFCNVDNAGSGLQTEELKQLLISLEMSTADAAAIVDVVGSSGSCEKIKYEELLNWAFGSHDVDRHGSTDVDQAIISRLKRRPIWTELRSAFIATRRGGALRQRMLFAAREEIGASLETAVTGGSLTPAPVREFMSHMLTDGNETRVKDSYGSTEFPGIAMNGEISSNVELRLEPVRRGDSIVYSPDDKPNPRGEIVVRLKSGEHAQYWKRPDLNAESWRGGWYHTGDVGELDYIARVIPNQFFEIRPALGHSWTGQGPLLRIVDRVKQLEEIYVDGDSIWIAVSDLEMFYEGSPQFQTVVLVSDRNESGLVAVVVLAESEIPELIRAQNALSSSARGSPMPEDICRELLATLQGHGQRAEKKPYEIPVGIVVETKRWSEDEELAGGDRGLITVTGKPKRAAVKQAYHAKWMAQYESAKQLSLDSTVACTAVSRESQTSHDVKMEHVARGLLQSLHSRAKTESGASFECGRPLVVKRGNRVADCRTQDMRLVQQTLQTSDDQVVHVGTDIEVSPESLSQKTTRGRDWLEDMRSKDGRSVEKRFEFGKVAAPHTVGAESVIWEDLPAEELAPLQHALEQLREIALCMRARHSEWESTRKAAVAAASAEVERHLEDMKFAVFEAIKSGSVEHGLKALLRGRRRVERAKQSLERAHHVPEFEAAALLLNERTGRLRALGDELDVNTRELPITWSMDMDWCYQEWRSIREVVTCPMCSRNVFMDALSEHTDWISCSDAGLAPLGSAPEGSSMGGNTNITCEITGALIDAEANHLNDPETTDGGPLRECPTRTQRFHAIGYHVDRIPWAHEALVQLWGIAGDDVAAQALLRLVDKHRDGVFVNDKQGCFWLFDFVKYAGPSPHKRTGGRPDTPASLVVRACNAFADRPCLAVPDLDTMPETDTKLSRVTSRTALPDAAQIIVEQRSGFLWLAYKDIGFIVDRIARGLLLLGLDQGSYVAISGYNDFEFACADFAISVAGMVSVGVHGTYGEEDAVAVIDKVNCAALLFSKDLAMESRRRDAGRWCVQRARWQCPSLSKLVVMDCQVEDAGIEVDSSFLYFVSPAAEVRISGVVLPDPFDARGARYQLLESEEVEDLMTILFTSGSSGTPKAVAVGSKAFIHDIAGCKEEAETISRSITVSYIALTHSSDRYKVWQHLIYGGRVGFCQFGAENWEWRETDKSTAAGTSPVDHLFNQVAALRPNSMSCPPNIWAGLHDCYRAGLASGLEEEAALSSVAGRFGRPHRVTHLSTGGAPTPQDDLLFARRLCHHMGCGFVNSYGATEAGALTADGRQHGEKFRDIQVQLIDWGSYTSQDRPHPRGEIVVQSPCLALGYQGSDGHTREAFIVADTAAACDIKPPLPPGRWYRTGDLGFFDHTGCLHLLDRTSSVLCTSKGSELRAGEVENALESLTFVYHCVIHCRGDEILCAVSVAHGIEEEKLKETVPWADFVGALHGEPLHLVVDTTAWTVQNEMLTGTLKKARKRVIDHYFPTTEKIG